MLRSFRFRIALLSVLISGLVLLAFGALAWWSLDRSRMIAVDEEIRNFGLRVALRSGPNVDTGRLEASLIEDFGAADNHFFTLLNSRSRLIFSSSSWPTGISASELLPGDTEMNPQPEDLFRASTDKKIKPRTVFEPRFYTIEVDGTSYRIGAFSNTDIIFVLGTNLQQQAEDMHQLRKAFLVALPVALLLVALGAAFVSWRALRPVEALGHDMESISARDLNHRLDINGADREFERIIDSYNAMLERLERSFHQATRFSADVSHELKTPLTIMQGTLEKALTKCGEGTEAQTALVEVLEQTGKQRSILESLLMLSRADAGKLELTRENINLSELLEAWLEDASFLAEQKNIEIVSEITPDVSILADPIALQQVAHNLFSNAVRYNHEGGEILCQLTVSGTTVEWMIANTGDPISSEDRELIFERFYRSKSCRGSGGVGLGLSLVKEIISAHGGSIGVDTSSTDRNRFTIRLPR